MRTQSALGFLVTAMISWHLSTLAYQSILHNANPWLWLLGLPALGYWIGQAMSHPFQRVMLCGWIAPPILFWLPILDNMKGYVSSWPYTEITGLLFCLPAALGQLRCTLRKAPQRQLPP